MEIFTDSTSTRDGKRMQQIENSCWCHPCGGDHQEAASPGLRELRSYSTTYVSSPYKDQVAAPAPVLKMKKSMSMKWGLIKDPELQRKKRVASYKAYEKGSFGKSFKWIKDTCHHVFSGGWR